MLVSFLPDTHLVSAYPSCTVTQLYELCNNHNNLAVILHSSALNKLYPTIIRRPEIAAIFLFITSVVSDKTVQLIRQFKCCRNLKIIFFYENSASTSPWLPAILFIKHYMRTKGVRVLALDLNKSLPRQLFFHYIGLYDLQK